MNSPAQTTQPPQHVAIIGAGIIGVATAIWLQRAGHTVTLIDKAGPAEGASYGNAGVLASCAVVPVTGPGLLPKIPRMLLDPNQPLFLKWGYLPKLFPWLVRYLSHANAADTKRIADALMPLVSDSLQSHQDLARGTGAEKWIVPCDYLYLYRDRAHFEGDRFAWSIRRQHGFTWDELEGSALTNYEPHFSPTMGFAVRIGNHGRIIDPGEYVKDLAAHVVKQGGKLRIATVQDLIHDQGRVTGVRAGSEVIAADAVVITAGVWSGPLARQLNIAVPLEAERGYHLELWEPNFMPEVPVMVAAGKFVATPMEGRLRLAGIVEFGGIKAPATPAAFDLLERQIRATMPALRWREATRWMGFRPAPADSIPVIGPVPRVANAYLGFGHHHIGLTGGSKTGRLLAQMISGAVLNEDVSVYTPKRFIHR